MDFLGPGKVITPTPVLNSLIVKTGELEIAYR